jgi:hypothetical protein
VWGVQINGTGLCFEMNKAGVWRAVNRYGLCLELNRAGVGPAVNRCRFVFGTEKSSRFACR